MWLIHVIVHVPLIRKRALHFVDQVNLVLQLFAAWVDVLRLEGIHRPGLGLHCDKRVAASMRTLNVVSLEQVLGFFLVPVIVILLWEHFLLWLVECLLTNLIRGELCDACI